MSNLYVVTRRFGRDWIQGATADKQPEWDAHEKFMDELNEKGIVLLAGPLVETETALVILRADTFAEAQSALSQDPWTLRDILPIESVRQWDVRIGASGYDA